MLHAVTALALLAACGRADPCAQRSSPRTCLVARYVGDTPNGELGFRFGAPIGGDVVAGGRFEGVGYAALWSGGKLVQRWAGTQANDLYGQHVMLVPGVGVVVAAPMTKTADDTHGLVEAYARGGERIWRATGGRDEGLGWSLARAGDLDGDGVDDLWVGAVTNPERGHVYLLSGRDGHVIRRIDGPRREDAFGWYVDAIADLDGDGKPDVAIGAPGAPGGGAVTLVSSATGLPLRVIAGDRDGVRFGEMLAALDDLDGDGAPELAIGAPGNPNAPHGTGEVVIVSSRTGKTLHRIIGQHDGELFGRMIAVVDDLDGDGARDLAIGAPWYAAGAAARAGRVEVRSARTLRVLAELRGDVAGAWLGWHIARATAPNGHKAMLVSAIRAERGAGALELHAFE